MALPPALLQFVEQHGCFSGCYGSNSGVQAFTAATYAPQPMVSVSCLDCLVHIGTLASLLPQGMHSYQLADELSRHVRADRGYSQSLSGYHTQGPGFWFSAVYWSSCRIFLLDGERSRKMGTDLDLLMLAFQHGVLKPPTPAMLDPTSFAVQSLFLDVRRTIPPVASKADLLTAHCVSAQPAAGWKRVTMAEFVAAPPHAAPAIPAKSATPTIGQRCPKCGAEVRPRALLNQTFIGCLC
jgi:hypothetical protein